MLKFASLCTQLSRGFATKLQAASTKNTKDSAGRHLGTKKLGGEYVYPNDIIIRQRGFKWKPGHNTLHGRDHTIHATKEGYVKFTKSYKDGRKTTAVHVIPEQRMNTVFRPARPYCYHPELYPELAKYNPEPTNFPIPQREPIQRKMLRDDYPVMSSVPIEQIVINAPNWTRQRTQHWGKVWSKRPQISQEAMIANETEERLNRIKEWVNSK